MADTEEGWLTPDESSFLEQTLRDRKLYQYLYTRDAIKLRYPPRYQGTYREFLSSTVSEFQRAHQTLRRLMNKSPYAMAEGQIAYTVLEDSKIPLEDLDIGSRITLGYRLLLLNPKYDIGKHSSLIELVFPTSIKILPVGESYYVMDEDHVFLLAGFERRSLAEHPSHGTPYHIDLLRMVMTTEVRATPSSMDESARIHVMLDSDEKPNLVVASANWQEDSPAKRITESAHGKNEIVASEFDEFKRSLGTMGSRFSAETLTALYRVSNRKRNIITKLLFEVHTHSVKVSHMVASFSSTRAMDMRYKDLEALVAASVTGISKELDTYFSDDAAVSSTASTLYMVVSSKHLNKTGDSIGAMVLFDNYLVGYTSTDSLTDVVAQKPGHVVISLNIPPRMPVLLLPEHTGISKYHRAVILPRDTVFQLEEIRSVMVMMDPRTYRKFYAMRYRRTEPHEAALSGEGHLLQVEPEMQSTTARTVLPQQ